MEIGYFPPSWTTCILWSVDLSKEFQYLINCVQCGSARTTRFPPLSAINLFQNDPALCTRMQEISFLFMFMQLFIEEECVYEAVTMQQAYVRIGLHGELVNSAK